MADEDEIDILGDFSFNSCFAQNNQGIPSCSSREDTVHPQWLLDSTEANWYDKETNKNIRDNTGPPRRLIGDNTGNNNDKHIYTTWSKAERTMLNNEMEKYGRNIKKISEKIVTKTQAEIQAVIDAEYGIDLEPATYELNKYEVQGDVPAMVQEEIVADTNINKYVTSPIHPFRKKTHNKPKNRLLKSKTELKPESLSSVIFYDDEMIIGSTESVSSDIDLTDIVSRNVARHQARVKAEKKIGNHRRKAYKHHDKGRPRATSKELLKSPQGRQHKDSSLSDDSVKSQKMQIVMGSGWALPVSEGEQVIKIEKRKDSEPESDIDIDIDSDYEDNKMKIKVKHHKENVAENPIAFPLRKFEPLPRRQKKLNLDGDGGYTIMHTEAGDLYELGKEPRRERQPRKQTIHLIKCKVYNSERPAPYTVRLNVSTLLLMDGHAHTSQAEVMGLTGGLMRGTELTVCGYKTVAAAAARTHCDMCPVSQAAGGAALRGRGLVVCGWHHSHPQFGPAPSRRDLRSQRALQRALERPPAAPLAAFITSQQWPRPHAHKAYRCFRVEDVNSAEDPPSGYQFDVQLVPDITAESLPPFLQELRTVLRDNSLRNEFTVDMVKDICPQARMTYLEKFICSVTQHLNSSGYSEDDPIRDQLIQGLRDIFR